MDDGPVSLLEAARMVERHHFTHGNRHFGLRLGDQTGILDRLVTERLVAAASELLPERPGGLVVGGGVADVLIGYLLAGALQVPLSSVRNDDGVVQTGGLLSPGSEVWLVATVLDDRATIDEYSAACDRAGARPGGVAALVDRLPAADPRVHSLLRWADHSWPAEECPLCST